MCRQQGWVHSILAWQAFDFDFIFGISLVAVTNHGESPEQLELELEDSIRLCRISLGISEIPATVT
jgi:hypothetical protein